MNILIELKRGVLPDDFRQTLKLYDLSEEGFKWQELEVEKEEKVVKQEGQSLYGGEIPIQDHTFKFVRLANNNVGVFCLSGNRQLWVASFSTRIPTEEFAKIFVLYKNDNADFREIEQLLNVRFRRIANATT